MSELRILVLSDEVWNDELHGNNVLTNWFEGTNAEFANIYCNPGTPLNRVCQIYYQLTDMMMFKSIFGGKEAGTIIPLKEVSKDDRNISVEELNIGLYRFLKGIDFEFMRVLRELIWSFGRYNTKEIEGFIKAFDPDIIFCARKATHKILRLERVVKGYSSAPLIVFTGDDEYSMKQVRFSPLFWVTRLSLRHQLSQNMPLYNLYYTHSTEQGETYHKKFGINHKRLFKGSDISKSEITKNIGSPIILVYAGKLYCNRWKILVKLAEFIREINAKGKVFELRIYTKDEITSSQRKQLDDGKNSFVLDPVSSEELVSIYEKADIALHVESFDIKNKYLTRYSFSTKIIDCLGSSCAVMAVCWEEQTGFKYLKDKDAAICAGSYEVLKEKLNMIRENPNIIDAYRHKAWLCASENHDKKKIQRMMFDDFKSVAQKRKV